MASGHITVYPVTVPLLYPKDNPGFACQSAAGAWCVTRHAPHVTAIGPSPYLEHTGAEEQPAATASRHCVDVKLGRLDGDAGRSALKYVLVLPGIS